MTGIIVSTPPTVEVPPGNNSSNPSSLPGVTYQYALLNIPQTWTALQTFPLGNISVQAVDVVGLASALGPGVASNVLNTRTANYIITTTDAGKTIQAGTGSTGFFTITLPSVSGFAVNAVVTILNNDTGRGKLLSGFPSNVNSILWPGQAITVGIVNGAWAALSLPGRWKTPGAPLTINCDFVNGLDTNDGLATGAGNAMKTVEAALSLIDNYFDLNGTTGPTTVTILMAADDSQGIHQSFHSWIGANGGAAVKIDGGGHAFTTVVQFYYGVIVQLRNVTFSNPSGFGLSLNFGAIVYLLDGITFGACVGGFHISVGSGASHLEILNSYTVSGSALFHISVDSGASVSIAAGVTVTISNALSMTDWVVGTSPAVINMSPATFNLAGHTVTGGKALLLAGAVAFQSSSTLAVTGAVSGTAGVCRLTLAATASLAESQRVVVIGVAGATGCNGTFAIHIVDGTHIELTGSTFGGVYTSGGTVQIGMPGTSDPSTSSGGQYI